MGLLKTCQCDVLWPREGRREQDLRLLDPGLRNAAGCGGHTIPRACLNVTLGRHANGRVGHHHRHGGCRFLTNQVSSRGHWCMHRPTVNR